MDPAVIIDIHNWLLLWYLPHVLTKRRQVLPIWVLKFETLINQFYSAFTLGLHEISWGILEGHHVQQWGLEDRFSIFSGHGNMLSYAWHNQSFTGMVQASTGCKLSIQIYDGRLIQLWRGVRNPNTSNLLRHLSGPFPIISDLIRLFLIFPTSRLLWTTSGPPLPYCLPSVT
jgi:hypothetical protein